MLSFFSGRFKFTLILLTTLVLFFFFTSLSADQFSTSLDRLNNLRIPLSSIFSTAQEEENISSTTLSDRLVPIFNDLLNSPVSISDYSVKNSKCSIALQSQTDHNYVGKNAGWWKEITDEDVRQKRRNLVKAVEDELEIDLGLAWSDDENYKDSRGIVFTGGNLKTASKLLTNMKIIRHRLGCKLPVEIFAFPQEIEELSDEIKQGFEQLGGVEWKEVIGTEKDPGQWKNFQVKGEAILRSTFTQVLYLDSDNVPLRNPEFLFDSPEYKKTGAVFWPDLTKDGPKNPVWRILGIDCVPEHWGLDSGQVLINKAGQHGLNYVALIIANEMQRDYEFWFRISNGDKDTFRYAFYALRIPYTPTPVWLSSVGRKIDSGDHDFCGHTMFQYGISKSEWKLIPSSQHPKNKLSLSHPPPLFLHANLLKHSSSSANNLGNTFLHVKHLSPSISSTSISNLENLEKLRSTVYWTSERQWCVDIWFEGGGEGILLEELREAWGSWVGNVDEMWYGEGGDVGGMR